MTGTLMPTPGLPVFTQDEVALAVPDSAPVTLRRVQGGPKGPVLLVHGVAVSSDIFAMSTVQENFVSYLARNGYDVWLVDWRGSINHPLSQFTLDTAAMYDMPAAVAKIREVTKAKSIQAVVHCAGSVVFFMSMSMGLLPDVRSVIASQVAVHTVTPPISRFKARIGLADRLANFGVTRMSPNDDDGKPLFQWAFGKATDVAHHECDSTFCHRSTFIYGHLYRHAQLNQATHDDIESQFGPCNITALRQFSQLAASGYSHKFDYGTKRNKELYGTKHAPSYVDPTHFNLPITLFSGAHNDVWAPKSTELSYEWLCTYHDPAQYARHLLPDYGHLDTFMGAKANVDVYPLMLDALEKS